MYSEAKAPQSRSFAWRKNIKSKNARFDVSEILMMLFSAYMLSGNTSSSALYIAIGIYAVWATSILYKGRYRPFHISYDNATAFLLFYLIYLFFVTFPKANLVYALKQVGAGALLFSPMLIYSQFHKLCYEKKLRTIKLSLLVYLLFCVISLIAYEQYGISARSLAANRERYGDIAIGGGYTLAYSAAILSVMMLDIIVKKRVPRALRWEINAAAIVIMGILIWQTKSTITLLCWISGMALCMMFPLMTGKNTRAHILHRVLTLAAVCILFVAVLNMDNIGLWLLKNTSNSTDTMMSRLNSLASWMAYGSGETDSSYFLGRFTLPLMSLDTFLRNPIYGVAYYHGNGFTSSRAQGIGQHGEWADALGNYGIFGGIPFLLIYYYYIANTMKKAKGAVSFIWCIVVILMGAFNPIRSFHVNYVVFFIIPALIDIVNQTERQDEHS